MLSRSLDNPFLEMLDVRLIAWRDGYAEMVMPVDARKLNRQGVVQGGAVATLLDAASGYAGIFRHLTRRPCMRSRCR